MSAEDSILFKSLTIGQNTIPGRVIKAATSETRADKDGFATQAHIDFYLPIAKGGTPLIITGNIYVSFDGKSTPIGGVEGEIILGQYQILKIGNESIEMAYPDGRGRQTIRLTGQ